MTRSRPPLSDRPDLATDDLLLRRPHAGDLDAIVGIVGDRDVALRLARVPHPYARGDATFFLERVVPAEWVWAITRHGSDALIGAVGLTPDGAAHTAELGYWLAREQWGRGIATQAARRVVTYGWDALGLRAITSGCFLDNLASARVLHKLGFVETARLLRPCLAAGREVPAIAMRLARPASG